MEKKDMAETKDAGEANTLDIQGAANLLELSPRRIQYLAAEGWIQKSGAGRYPIVPLVRGYVRFLKEDNARKSKSAADGRLRDARAREVEQRIAERDRGLVALDEALGIFDEVTGSFLQTLSGAPARITRNQSERRRLEAIFDADRQRLADHFAERRLALRTGRDADPADDPDDSGRVGAAE